MCHQRSAVDAGSARRSTAVRERATAICCCTVEMAGPWASEGRRRESAADARSPCGWTGLRAPT